MKSRRKRVSAILVIAVSFIVAFSLMTPAQGVSGQWRLLNPTEYTNNAAGSDAANMNGIFLTSGGTSGKGSGNGWAVSDFGNIFFWDGFSWGQVGSGTGCNLNAVNFGGPLNPLSSVTSSSGWIVGGGSSCATPNVPVSLYWGNGAGWSLFPVPSTGGGPASMTGVFLVKSASSQTDSVNAFAAGSDNSHGAIWVWNGVPGQGGAWSESCGTIATPCAAPTSAFNSIYMTACTGSPCSGSDGIAVGNGGEILRLIGGAPYSPEFFPGGANLNGVAMSSPTSGWAVGTSCTIIQTTDGTNWSGGTSGGCGNPALALRSIVLVSSSEGWAVGDTDSNGPTILHGTSLNSSPVWTRIPKNQVTSNVNLRSVTLATSGGNLWSVGGSGVAAFCQSNCGSTSGSIWSTTTSPIAGPNAQLNSVYMDSDSDGWAVGTNSTHVPVIAQWNGYSWTQAASLSPAAGGNTPLYGVFMSGGSNAWAVGGAGTSPSTIYFNGNSWTGVTPFGCACTLNSVYMISGSESWAVGTNGEILHSATTGGTFAGATQLGVQLGVTAGNATLKSVYFDPSSGGQSGWASGFIRGATRPVPFIVNTANDGADSWAHGIFKNPGGLPNGTAINSLFFQDSSHGWAAGNSSAILFWNGVSWNQVPVLTANPLNFTSIAVVGGPPATDGFAVGLDTGTGLPVVVEYNAGSNQWAPIFLSPPIPNSISPGALNGLFLRSSTNGLAVGNNDHVHSASLAFVLHLDPPGGVTAESTYTPPPVTTTTTASTTASSTSSVTSSETSSATIGSSSTSSTLATSSSSSVSTSVVTTPFVSTITSALMATSSTSSVSTPMALPPIPGFPWESIIAGIMLGVAALAVVRRRRK